MHERALSHTGAVRQLSPLDVQFLNVETDTTFAHVGCLVLLEPGPDGPLTVDAVRARIGARLPDQIGRAHV